MKLFNSIMRNLGRVCMLFGVMSAFFVVFSWLAGYWLNGLYGMHFQLDSCWQGVSACGMGLVGLLKWLIDSAKNSPMGEPPTASIVSKKKEE